MRKRFPKRAAGVSVATAAKALNGTGRMTAETRERVKRAAEDLCFRPNVVARALSRQRSMTVGLLTNDSYGRFTMPVMAGLEEALVDAPILPDLLGKIPSDEEIGSVTANGAYDTRKCHDAIADHGAHAVIPPRKNAKPLKTATAGAAA